MSLYIDDFIRQSGFATTEAYLRKNQDEILVHFQGIEHFTSLFEAGLLRPGVSRVIVRPSGTQYGIADDGKLTSITSGRKIPSDLTRYYLCAGEGWDAEYIDLLRLKELLD